MRVVKRPSKMAVRNNIKGLTALYQGCDTAPVMETSVKRGPQAEGLVNDEIAKWRNGQPSLFIERNKRRLAIPVGWDQEIMLGWLADGSSDWVGWESVVVTPGMLGKRIAVFVGLETKSANGVTSEAQDTFMDRLRDDGGITGVARSSGDCELIRQIWKERMCK